MAGTGFRQSQRFQLIHRLLRKYAKKFFIKVEEIAVNGDHLHFVVRATRRSLFQHFLRVLAGQIAQQLEKEGLLKAVREVTDTPVAFAAAGDQAPKLKRLWKHRPFTRVVRGYQADRRVRAYVRLNEKEACGEIKYQKRRTRELNPEEWVQVWT